MTDRTRVSESVIILDDDDDYQPPVRAAVRYYERNLGWTAIPDAFAGGTVKPHDTAVVPRCRAVRLPVPPVEPPFKDFRPF